MTDSPIKLESFDFAVKRNDESVFVLNGRVVQRDSEVGNLPRVEVVFTNLNAPIDHDDFLLLHDALNYSTIWQYQTLEKQLNRLVYSKSSQAGQV